MDRRVFLKQLETLAAGTACFGLPSIMTGCAATTTSIRANDMSADRLSVKRNEVHGNSALLRWKGSNLPIYLHMTEHDGREQWTAVWTSCTHLGCEVEPDSDRLVCPCHGGEFTFDGKVVKGPPKEPLRSFPVTVEGDTIFVHLSKDGASS